MPHIMLQMPHLRCQKGSGSSAEPISHPQYPQALHSYNHVGPHPRYHVVATWRKADVFMRDKQPADIADVPRRGVSYIPGEHTAAPTARRPAGSAPGKGPQASPSWQERLPLGCERLLERRDAADLEVVLEEKDVHPGHLRLVRASRIP